MISERQSENLETYFEIFRHGPILWPDDQYKSITKLKNGKVSKRHVLFRISSLIVGNEVWIQV